MKNNLLNLIITTLILIFSTSCNKKEVIKNVLSEAEAVEVIQQTLATNTSGMVTQIEDAAKIAIENFEMPCNETKDSTITKTNTSGVRTYAYVYNWNWEMFCNNIIPQQLNFNYATTGNYDTPRISSEDSASFGFKLTGLSPTQSHYIYNGNYTRNGVQQSKIKDQNKFNSTLTLSTADLAYDKNEDEISSGSATFSLTGTVVDGDSFSYDGSITFLGGGAATLILNGGTYDIQL